MPVQYPKLQALAAGVTDRLRGDGEATVMASRPLLRMDPERSSPPPLDRRRFLAGSLGTAGLVGAGTLSTGMLLSACTGGGATGAAGGTTAPAGGSAAAAVAAETPNDLVHALAVPGSPGLVDEAAYQRRVDEFLRFATNKLDVQSPTGIAAQLVRAHREPTYTWDTSAATVPALQDVWKRFDEWQDVRDFRVMFLHWVLALADGSSPSTTLSPELLATIRRYLVGNRYRYNDPLPADVIDNQWFWSENHQIIGLVTEYLTGTRFPADTFTITGLTGAQHAERSRQPILDWVDERARFGFSEWHSNTYMLKNITPLLTLAELAEDPELVRAAGMVCAGQPRHRELRTSARGQHVCVARQRRLPRDLPAASTDDHTRPDRHDLGLRQPRER